MFQFLKSVIFTICLLLAAGGAYGADGGQIILDLKEEPIDEIYDYPKLYQEYMRELDILDAQYPNEKINENLSEDVAEMHPEYTEDQVRFKADLLKLGIRWRRLYRNVRQDIKKILLDNDIPLSFADDEYEMGEKEEYQPTDKPLIIKKFKKVVAYSKSERDRAAAAEKAARDAGLETPYERKQVLRKAFLQQDWKTLFTYGLFEGTDFDDKRGIGEWVKTPELQARIVCDVKNFAGTERINGALQLYPNRGWFLLGREYQGAPAAKADFSASENAQDIVLNWPLPKRYFSEFKQSFAGYPTLLTIPLEFVPIDDGQPLLLKADVSAGVCNDKFGCRQVKLQPQLELKPDKTAPKNLLAVSLRMMRKFAPHENSALKLTRLTTENGILRLDMEISQTPDTVEAFIEGDGPEEFAPPLLDIGKDKIIARFVPLNKGADLVGKEFSVAVAIAPDVSVRQQMTVEPMPLSEAEHGGISLRLLGLAFWGGLLLNLMPCGFAFLALRIRKFTSFGMSGLDKTRLNFAAESGGILVFVMLLAIAAIVCKKFGCAVGWGVQYQNAALIFAALFAVLLLIAVVSGHLTLRLPEAKEPVFRFLAGGVLVGLSVFSGAPHLSYVIGQALSGSSAMIAIVFAMVGFGVSAPYAAVALMPQIAYYLPPPGKWLRGLNLLIYIMLWAFVFWLTLILSLRCGAGIWWLVPLFAVAVWFVLYMHRLFLETLDEQENDVQVERIMRRMINAAATVLLTALLLGGGYYANAAAAVTDAPEAIDYAQIKDTLRQGGRVLLKVNADWCLSCQYSDFVLASPQVQNILDAGRFTVMEANWSNYNQQIWELMQKFGRNGLPFYAVFTPDIPDGAALPENLNEIQLRTLLENFSR